MKPVREGHAKRLRPPQSTLILKIGYRPPPQLEMGNADCESGGLTARVGARGDSNSRCHAKKLGYDGVILCLDELSLLLASDKVNDEFVTIKAARPASLVEGIKADLSVPITTSMARLRDPSKSAGVSRPASQQVYACIDRQSTAEQTTPTLEPA